MYSASLIGTRSKPSWAFDVADASSRNKGSKSVLQNYRIPYPSSPEDENAAADQKFLCARAFLIIVNILCFVVGFASIITAIAAAAKPETCEMCHSVLNPFLVLGFVISFIAVLGIYGALSNSYTMLLVYVTLVAFLFMVQMVVFFWSLFGRVNFQRRMHTMLRNKMRHQPHQLTELLNLVQQRLPCCGVDGPLDYHSAGLQLPLSCCSPSGGAQCTIQAQPAISSTPTPQLNATVSAGNTTFNFNTTATDAESAAVNTSTAAPEMALPGKLSPEADTTAPEAGKILTEAEKTSSKAEETSTEADETSTEAEETSTEAGKTSYKAEEASTEAKETSTEAEETSTEAEKTSSEAEETSTEAEETSTVAKETSTEAEETSTKAGKKSSKAGKTTSKAEETSTEAEETWSEAEETLTEAEETSPEAEAEPPWKVRPKRSVTDRAEVTPGPNDETVGPTEEMPGNGSQIILNATAALTFTGNFSVNGTTDGSLEELFSNRTNLTGGPEPWDIHHVKKRGCYSVLKEEADRHHGWMLGITLGAAALLSLQLVVLCTAHRVARGDFIQQE